MKLKMSGTLGPSLVGVRRRCWIGGGGDRATISPEPATPVTRAVEPAGISLAAVALNSWVWPSFLTSTLP